MQHPPMRPRPVTHGENPITPILGPLSRPKERHFFSQLLPDEMASLSNYGSNRGKVNEINEAEIAFIVAKLANLESLDRLDPKEREEMRGIIDGLKRDLINLIHEQQTTQQQPPLIDSRNYSSSTLRALSEIGSDVWNMESASQVGGSIKSDAYHVSTKEKKVKKKEGNLDALLSSTAPDPNSRITSSTMHYGSSA
jgi:hypothetical protein